MSDDDVRDLLENELENVTGEISPTELLGRVRRSLPDGTAFDEAAETAADILDTEAPATDGGTATDDSSNDAPETPQDPIEVDYETIADHYRRVTPALEAIADLDGHPTIGLNDYYGWYIKRDHDDFDLLEDGFDRLGRVATLADDKEAVLDRAKRAIYAVTTYKDSEALDHERPCTYDAEEGETVWKDDEDPMPGYADIRAAPAWGDVDLCDDIKPKRGNLDQETRETVEATLEAYIREFATLYGGRDAVYALDSVGGAYIFGAPEATHPIANHFDDDRDARARVMEAFIERSNDWLAEAQERVNEQVDGAADVIDPDWVNNKNRQYKAPLSLHADHDAVVTPIDVDAVDYELTPIDAVDDELVDEGVAWGEALTNIEHTDAVATLVENLWPDYADEYDSWEGALEAWAEDEREAEREAEQQRLEARQRREERRDEIDGDLEGQPITPFLQDIYDDVNRIDTADVVKHHASDTWDSGRSTGSITEFDPSWRSSSSGSSCYVDEGANTFGDPGQGGGGYATKAMALGAGIIRDASTDLEGSDWWEAVDELRNAGYDIPIWTPEAGSKRSDGSEYQQMPFWAVRKAALALGVCPPEAFVERDGDDGGTYLGFPGPETYNNALEAIEEAGLEHGREYADTGPDYPVYDVLEAEDVEVEMHIVPINGKEVRLEIHQNGQQEYTEVQEREFWTSGAKRGQIAGRIGDTLTGVDQHALKQGVKDAINRLGVDADTQDDFDEQLRSGREQKLRDRTTDVVCYPGADATEWVITMRGGSESPVDEPQEITLDEGDLNDGSAGTFRNVYLATFYKKVEIDSEEWNALTDYWLSVADIRERDPDHEREAAVDNFTDWVKSMKVWADEEGFEWSSRNGLYSEDYHDGKDAILVPGQKVVDWQGREDIDDVNLSRALREDGVLLRAATRKTIAGNQRRVWPVDAEKTPHTIESAHRVVDDDAEDKPEGLR